MTREDAISRQAVLYKIKEVCFSREQEWVDFRISQGSNGQRDFIIKFIEDLPSIQPKPKTEKVIKMRDLTPEERELIDKYIKSISKPTGINFWDLEQEPCEDMVSRGVFEQVMWERDVAIDQLKELGYGLGEKPKTGHWIYIGNSEVNGLKICKCSNCKKKTYGSHKFCPNCGAKMAESEDREC